MCIIGFLGSSARDRRGGEEIEGAERGSIGQGGGRGRISGSKGRGKVYFVILRNCTKTR